MSHTKFLSLLQSNGIDTTQGLDRFMGNQELYLSFIRRLPEFLDSSPIRDALEARDQETFYLKIHALDGVAGNLGVTTIYECCQAILVEFHLSKFQNESKLLGLMQEIEQESARIADLLQECEATEEQSYEA